MLDAIPEEDLTEVLTLVGRLESDGETTTTLVEESPFTIGRRGGSLRLTSNSVSGLHAEIRVIDDKYFVKDLGSTNGTFLNGERVFDEAELHDGDWLQFASLPFHVKREVKQSSSQTMDQMQSDKTLGLMQFERLMANQAVIPLFQPIQNLETGEIVALEVLASSPLVGLRSAGEMFKCAEDLGLVRDLSQLIRKTAVERCQQLGSAPHLFMNAHPAELSDLSHAEWIVELPRTRPASENHN